MIQIYADQIFSYIKKIELLQYSYILFGSSNVLLQETKDFILEKIKDLVEVERYYLQSNTEINWIQIENFIKNYNIFSKKKVITFQFLNKVINKQDIQNIRNLINLLHKDVILIVIGGKNIKKILKYDICTTLINKYSILINCSITNKYRMLEWIKNKTKNMEIYLEKDICKFLCYLYEGDILGLSQLITNLHLLDPEKKFNKSNIKDLAKKSIHFLPIHLVYSILERDQKRILEIIQQIFHNKVIEPTFLLRILQKEIILLILLIKKVPEIKKNNIISNYGKNNTKNIKLQLIDIKNLYKSIHIMKIIELSIKRNQTKNIWIQFYTLVLIICKMK